MKKIKILALLSAVVTAVLVFLFLNSLLNMNNDEVRAVITAAQDIPPNTSITNEMITKKDLPVEAVIPGSTENTEDVVGKISKSEILTGEQILNGKLLKVGDSNNGTLAYTLEPGMRAITILVDVTSGLSGMLKPKDRIDLIGEFEYTPQGQAANAYTSMVVENIKILAVDSILAEQGKTDGSAYASITLEATPKQAMEISMAVYKGQLRALLRSPLDKDNTNLPNITIDNVLAN